MSDTIHPTTPPIDAARLSLGGGSSSDVPRLVTALPGPKAAAAIARDQAVMSPSYTRAYPLVVDHGHGSTIVDVDGNRFLDLTAGIAVTATGHAHPRVVDAIARQAARLIHMSGTDFYYESEIALAERLAALAPGAGGKRVFFTNSGAESIEAALKLARYHTGRQRVIAFYGGFHGRTYGAMSIGGSKSVHQRGFGPLLPGVHRLAYNCSAADVDELFATACPADEVAAIVVEPIQGEGGYRMPREGFLPMLRQVCDRHGMLLVMDEIQSGMGRTGRMLGCEHFGVVPDIVCLAKGIASGMPLGAIVARAELMNWPPGSHASTFGGNPVSCQAALATLDLLESEYLANAAARGEQLIQGLRALESDPRCRISGARGLGLMLAVDVLGADDRPDAGRRDRVVAAAFERGLLLLGCGRNAIRFCPPLCITAAEIQTALELFASACQAAE